MTQGMAGIGGRANRNGVHAYGPDRREIRGIYFLVISYVMVFSVCSAISVVQAADYSMGAPGGQMPRSGR